MSLGPNIREFRSSDWESLQGLYRKHFGDWAYDRFRARWDWEFRTNPWVEKCPIKILVGEIDGQIVGHATSFPLPLRMFGTQRPLWCSGDLVAAPRHGLLAIMLAKQVEEGRPGLSTGMRSEAERIAHFQGSMTIPSTQTGFEFRMRSTGAVQRSLRRRLPAALRGLASRPLAALVAAFAKPGRPTLPGKPELALEPFERFGQEHERVWAGMCEWVQCALDRDARYLNWRYVDGPARQLIKLQLRDAKGGLRGYSVAGVRVVLADDHEPCGTLGELLELVVCDVADASAVRALASGALHALASTGVDAVVATGLAAPFAAALQEIGFTLTPSAAKMMLSFEPEELAKITAKDTRWYTSSGDGDQLFTTLL